MTLDNAMKLMDVQVVFTLENIFSIEKTIELENNTSFEKLVFKIDKPFEMFALQGCTTFLVVCKDVAIQAMKSVNTAKGGGLPLDADDSFSNYPDKNSADILGLITSAKIESSDFFVKGHLFPWSPKNKAGDIINPNNLGIFLNGKVLGNIVEINESKVLQVSSLEFLGGNLFLTNNNSALLPA
jgi:hypothetical protein